VIEIATQDTDWWKQSFVLRAPNLLRIQKQLLEDLFDEKTLRSLKSRHPAAARWRLCSKIVGQGGIIKWSEQGHETPLLAEAILDAITFVTVSAGDVQQMKLFDLSGYGDKAVQAKLRSRINNPSQFKHLMVELSVGAWHQGIGHQVTPFEKEGWPDIRADVPGFEYPIFLECKRVEVLSNQRIAKHIQNANRQIKEVGTSAYGVAVLDVTGAIGSKLAPIRDEKPQEIVQIIEASRAAISGPKNRCISRVLLMWDESGIFGNPPERTMVVLRRCVASIDHEPLEGVIVIPPELPLFGGNTVELPFNFSKIEIDTLQVSDLMKECSAWFRFTTDALIDAFKHLDKWERMTVASDAGYVLFARQTTFKNRPSYTIALGKQIDHTLHLQFAIRIPFCLHNDVDLLTPLEMLQVTIERYGLLVTIGGVTGHFVLRHSFEAQTNDLSSFFHVHNPDNHSLLLSLLIKITPRYSVFAVDSALVFALDRTRLLMDLM